MSVTIKSGDLDVYDSGVVLTAIDDGIDFNLAGLDVRIVFADDRDSKNNRITSKAVSDTELELKAFNFNSKLGTGTKSPIIIGRVGDRHLLFSFWAYTQGDAAAVRKVNYTFYLGGKVDGE